MWRIRHARKNNNNIPLSIDWEKEREKLQNTKNIVWNIDFLNYFHLSSGFFPFARNCVWSHAVEVCYYIWTSCVQNQVPTNEYIIIKWLASYFQKILRKIKYKSIYTDKLGTILQKKKNKDGWQGRVIHFVYNSLQKSQKERRKYCLKIKKTITITKKRWKVTTVQNMRETWWQS